MAEVCSICLADMNSADDVELEKCGHSFHSSCIGEWIRRDKNTCPCCRSPISAELEEDEPPPLIEDDDHDIIDIVQQILTLRIQLREMLALSSIRHRYSYLERALSIIDFPNVSDYTDETRVYGID